MWATPFGLLPLDMYPMCLSLPCAGEGRANATCPCFKSPLLSSALPGNPLFHADSRPQSIKKPSNIIRQRRAPWPGQSGQCTLEGSTHSLLSKGPESSSVTAAAAQWQRGHCLYQEIKCVFPLEAYSSKQLYLGNVRISIYHINIYYLWSQSPLFKVYWSKRFDLKRCIFHVICQSYIHSNCEPKTQ